MTRVAELLFSRAAPLAFERIAHELIPRTGNPNRCCIQKDREIIRQRVIAVLGFGLEDTEELDQRLLADYVSVALARKKPDEPILSFINDACQACVKANYYITDVCRNCVAKPCIINCPKNAIEADEQRATIISTKCVNCGICQKVCPYHAIVYVPVPCEESCPAGAIQKNAEGREFIDYDKCIFCGKCIQACPFGAVVEKSQLVEVIVSLLSTKKTVAMIAPAIAGQFDGGIARLAGALKALI
ncbi:MAG: 4Fe-4S binding protein [Deltaproteobacteria bacterium]|nr:4Fe-4S binding protein [Deltaproteobacteria bacterium]